MTVPARAGMRYAPGLRAPDCLACVTKDRLPTRPGPRKRWPELAAGFRVIGDSYAMLRYGAGVVAAG